MKINNQLAEMRPQQAELREREEKLSREVLARRHHQQENAVLTTKVSFARG